MKIKRGAKVRVRFDSLLPGQIFVYGMFEDPFLRVVSPTPNSVNNSVNLVTGKFCCVQPEDIVSQLPNAYVQLC